MTTSSLRALSMALLTPLFVACGSDAGDAPSSGTSSSGGGDEVSSSGQNGSSSSGGPGASSSSSGGGGSSSSGGQLTNDCTVLDQAVPGSSDFFTDPTFVTDAAGSGQILYAASGNVTGAYVGGTFAAALAAGVPTGAPKKIAQGREHAASPLADGFVAAVTADGNTQPTLDVFDANAESTSSSPLAPASNIVEQLSIVTTTDGSYASWVDDGFNTGRDYDTLWVAGYAAGGAPLFAAYELDLDERSVAGAVLVEHDGAPWLVYALEDGLGGTQLSWSRLSAAGALEDTVAPMLAGRVQMGLVSGDQLAIAWTGLTSVTPVVSSGEVRLLDFATGAQQATLTLGTDSASFDSMAIAKTSGGYVVAARRGDAQTGGVDVKFTDASLAVQREVTVSNAPALYTTTARGVTVTATAEGALVGWGAGDSTVHVARVTCP